MKSLKFYCVFLFTFLLLLQGKLFSQCSTTDDLGYYQENNSTAIISHSHDPDGIGNCIGFAIASTQQSYIGPICGQAKEITLDEAYAKKYWLTWGFYSNVGNFNVNNLSLIHNNDILIWDTAPGDVNYKLNHAAVVTSVYGNSVSIKYLYATQPDNSVHYNTLSSSNNYEDSLYGRPNYVVRWNGQKTYGYAITVKTSFNGGTVKVDGANYSVNGSAGTVVKNLSRGNHTLLVTNRQFDGTNWQGYRYWSDKYANTIYFLP